MGLGVTITDMRMPVPPPDVDHLVAEAARDGRLANVVLHAAGQAPGRDPYLPWDQLRHRQPPEGLTVQEWWLGIRIGRRSSERVVPSLVDAAGRPFRFGLPDQLLEDIDAITRAGAGQLAVEEQVTNSATRDRYVVNSLIEEAIRSSQLEGAATTREVAKDMLRTGRPPRDRSERMIRNNFHAMQAIGDRRSERLTPAMVCEIHRIVTDGTLDDARTAGTLQDRDEDRVGVWSDTGELLHRPPPVEQLPTRLERLCAFANGETDDGYIPPLLRAIAVHFMMGHDHYFADGNGRTARAVFYWSMLNQGYWLTEFLTISRTLKAAPARYARAFVHTEQDDGDLTYVFLHQTGVIRRAIADLEEYLRRKTEELRSVQQSVRAMPGEFNHRELALLHHAVLHSGATYTVGSHQASHRTSAQTARSDLQHLERKGLLRSFKIGKKAAWTPPDDLAGRLASRP